jgi:hypothetical protein
VGDIYKITKIMEDKICIILPTRERLNDFILFANSWKETTKGYSHVIAVVDDNDSTYDNLINENTYSFIWEKVTPKPMLHILNEIAVKYCTQYNYMAFMEDDVIIRTPNWETRIINKIKELGKNAIVWCNDLINGEKAVSLAFMNSYIVCKLGHMCIPGLKTMAADVYWKDLGNKLNSLYYFDDIILEHKHYITGKRRYDNTSYIMDSYLQIDRDYYNSQECRNQIEEDYIKLIS